MSERKWVRSSLDKLSGQLKERGHQASAPIVGRLLAKYDYALRVNVKKKEAGSQHPDRDAQFLHIEEPQAILSRTGLAGDQRRHQEERVDRRVQTGRPELVAATDRGQRA